MVCISLLGKVLPLLLLLGIGCFIKKRRFLADQTICEIKKLVVNLALPALLFTAFLDTALEFKYYWIIGIVFGVNWLMLWLGKATARVMKINNACYPLLFSGFETGMLGFSLFGTVYGLQNISTLGIIDLGQEFFVWGVLVVLLKMNNGKPHDVKKLVISLGSSPVILAIIVSIVFNVTGLKGLLSANVITAALLETIKTLSQLAIPLILIVIGTQITWGLQEIRLPTQTLIIRYGALIGLAFLINRFVLTDLLHLPAIFTKALLVMFILPPPFIIPLFIAADQDQATLTYVNNTLSLASLITIVIFMLIVFGGL